MSGLPKLAEGSHYVRHNVNYVMRREYKIATGKDFPLEAHEVPEHSHIVRLDIGGTTPAQLWARAFLLGFKFGQEDVYEDH